MPPRFVEVSHVIEPGMVTYPGLPVPEAAVIVDHDTSRERYGGLDRAGSGKPTPAQESARR
jgi:hypothetical protein